MLEEVRQWQQCAIKKFQTEVESILLEALENVTAESGSIIIEVNEDDDAVEEEGFECNVTEKSDWW